MLKFLYCLFGLHGATEIDYTVDDEEIKVCRDCLKEKQLSIAGHIKAQKTPRFLGYSGVFF